VRAAAAGRTRRALGIDGIAIASLLVIAFTIAAYVHFSMSQVRQSLPREVLEQQGDIAGISDVLTELTMVLDPAHRAGMDAVAEGLRVVEDSLLRLDSIRRDYTFDSLTGAAAIHALVHPGIQDVERWLREGVPGYRPQSPVVLSIAHVRARDLRDEVRQLEAGSGVLALSLLNAEAARLDRLRASLVALILSFAVLTAGVVLLYIRQRDTRAYNAVLKGRLSDSLDSVSEAVALFDPSLRLVMCNQRYRELLGLGEPRSAGKPTLQEVIEGALAAGRIARIGPEDGDSRQAYRVHREQPGVPFEMHWSDGRQFRVCEHVTHEHGIICMLSDITDLKVAHERLEHLASHDALTGLPGRRRFQRAMDQCLHRARRQGHKLAVLFVDLDRFKWVNDTYGHQAGDRVLRELGQRLRASLRDHDLVARLGGDEFVAVIEDVSGAAQAAASAQRTLAALCAPMHIEAGDVQATASIGIAMFPDDGEEAAVLLKKADDACYHAKSSGRANVQFFTERTNVETARRTAVEHRLRLALQGDALQMWYQPQFRLAGREVIGFEALLRWQDATLGWVMPAEVIAVAEACGLGKTLLAACADAVCRQAADWAARGLAPGRIWLNVSPRQLPDLAATLDGALERFAVDPTLLGVEITEHTLVEDPQRAGRILAGIKARGISLAIDDFGVGYSALGALKDYPLDELKIDASFVRNLVGTGHDVEIIRAIVALAQSLGLAVVAEGVETEAQLDVLRAQRVLHVQGNLLGKAAPAREAELLLTRADRTRAASVALRKPAARVRGPQAITRTER
jgi:diguanylate cyclase (GGDEF)-like protein